MSGKLVVLGAAVVVLGLVLLPPVSEAALTAVGDLLVVRDDLRPADLIHVISGPDYRTDYGIQLYKLGFGKRIFFTGGWCPEIQEVHAERGQRLAIAQGVPESAVAGDGYAVTSTFSEALRLRSFIAQGASPVRTVIVVSDPVHMRRSRWTYRQVLGPDVEVLMAPIPFEQTPYQRRWWTDPLSATYVRDEYLKLLYYVARYRLSWGPMRTWLESLDTE